MAAFGNLADMIGDIHITANTPRRAIAISSPIASAISLPLNHLASTFDTVVPAISQPQPKIINPRQAIFALPGNATHQLSSQPQKAVAWNQSEMPTNLIEAPITISPAERSPVNRTPILSRIIPAKIRNRQKTLRKYSEAAYVPNTELFQPRPPSATAFSIVDFRGDITSTNIYAKNIIDATRIRTAHRAIGLSFISL